MPPRQFANPVFERLTALSAMHRRKPGSSLTVKPRADRCYGRATALLSVSDLQLEAPFDEAGQARHDPSTSLFTADVDVTIIRVPHETVAATLKQAVQFIQREVMIR